MADARAVVRTANKKLTRSILDADTLLVAAGIKSTNSQNLDLAGASGVVAVLTANTFKGEGTAAIDWSAASGIFKTPTGVATFGGSSNTFTNNVGIGTTTPDTLLHVASGVLAVPAVDGRRFVISDPTLAAMSLVSSATGEAHVNFGDPSDIDIGRIIYRFSTNQLGFGTNATSDHMIIDANGNVGIGTTSPDEILHINNSGGNTSFVLERDTDVATQNAVILWKNPGGSTKWETGVSGTSTFVGDDDFYIAEDGTTANTRFMIAAGGNVGIGTPTPTAKLDVNGDLVVQGNITQQGSSTSIALASEEVRVADNHLLLNDGYVTAVAQTGGLVVNNLPTATTDTIAGAFVAGVPTASNPTVVTTGSTIFSVGDIVMISGVTDADLVGNNGLFEVLSHSLTTPNRLEIKGVGVTTTTFDEAQTDFDAGTPTGSPAITKIAVGIFRLGTDGIPETATGNATPLSFTDLALVTDTTLQNAYDNDDNTPPDAIITTNSTDGDVVIAGTEKLLVSAAGGLDVSSSGPVILANGTLDVPASTSMKIAGVALTSTNWTAAHLSTLLDGALHTDGWTTTGVSVGEVAAISANNTVVKADATVTTGNANVEGIVNLAGEVQQSGKVVGAQFVTGLALTVGDRIFLSKTAGALTTDVSAFGVGDVIQPLGRVRDITGYTGADIPNSKATISLIHGEPGEA